MPWSITLPDAENPGSNVTYDDTNLEGLRYDDEPGGFRSIIASTAAAGEYANKATSPTSHNFTTGSKTFSKVGGFGFAAGSAVRLANVAGTSYMDGLVTAIDHVANTVTINVLSVGAGSGPNNSWVITLGTNTSTIVSTPVSIANGGTAGTTAALARTNLAVKRHFDISSVLSTPPGSPTNGQTHIAGESPTGAWAGQENKLPVYVTGTGWTFVTADPGDAAYDIAAEKVYVYTGAEQNTDGIYPGSWWKELTPVKKRWAAGGSKTAGYTVLNSDHGKWFQSVASGGARTFVLPSPAAENTGMEIVVEVEDGSTSSVTFSIAGGSNFRLANGTEAASILVNSSTYARYHFVAPPAGGLNAWYVW
jgi:hypothetical protein